MGATPEELKQEIDQTREDLAATVDALATKVTPNRQTKVGLIAVVATLAGLLLLRRRRATA